MKCCDDSTLICRTNDGKIVHYVRKNSSTLMKVKKKKNKKPPDECDCILPLKTLLLFLYALPTLSVETVENIHFSPCEQVKQVPVTLKLRCKDKNCMWDCLFC